jgi:hypothetical protein
MLNRWLKIVGAAFLGMAMWIWIQTIAIPRQMVESAVQGKPRGNLSDLYPRWLGARELLLHHRDPYREDITREIQAGYYGRVLDPNRPNDPHDQQAFAYPVYVVLMLAPTVTLEFSTVQHAFFWLLASLVIASVPIWLQSLGWRHSATDVVLWISLTLCSFPAIQGLKLQQLTLLVVALLAVVMWALVCRQFMMAGALLALATIKPQLVFLVICWLGLWTLGNWRERQRVMWSFGVAMAVLVIAGEVLLPGWMSEFRGAMKDYYRYTGGGTSVLDAALPANLGRIAAVVLVGMLAIFAWRERRTDERSAGFQWLMCFTLATTLLVIPMFAPYNQVLLVPGVMMVVRARRQLWEKSPLSRFLCVLAGASVFSPFLLATCLVILLAFLPLQTVQKAWSLPFFYPSFAMPITMFLLLLFSKKVLSAGNESADSRGEPARLAT